MEQTWRRGSGKLPEFGAIFMSNTKTRGECFVRSIFGLPFDFAKFVREVRAGMVLFLYDYQQGKLFGVFEAVSDGGLNIVPRAYTSSGKSFPAQVQFRILWKCSPLCVHEFRDAILDNYYTKHKFNFGLSKDQVQRLLYLFDSRRFQIKKPPCEGKINDCHSDTLVNKKSSVEPLELGDFIPLFSPDSSGSSDSSGSQSSPCRSEIHYSPEHHPKVKGLYSDRLGERKSVFARLEDETKGTIGHLDIVDNARPCKDLDTDVEAIEEIMQNLLQRQKSWTNHVGRKRETPKVAGVFSRLNFNSLLNNQESENQMHLNKRRRSGQPVADVTNTMDKQRKIASQPGSAIDIFDHGGEAQ